MHDWTEHLKAATVALELPDGDGYGTGFVIAPGVVVTCAHVVAGARSVRARIVGTGLELAVTLSDGEQHKAAGGLDLAFLRFDAAAARTGVVLTAPALSPGDRMRAHGHPQGHYRPGQWAALEYLGDSRLSFDDPMPMPRGYGTPVGEGYSGSPVVNERTGAVCGMLARSDLAGSAHLVPVAEILARCTAPEPPVAWLRTLSDEQLRAGGFRHPGPGLRDYLEAARAEADEHPYAVLLSGTRDIPLSTVYVQQDASDTKDAPERQPGERKQPAAESVLGSHRHVLFTGGAGAGKSSLLRRLTYTAADAWLEDPGAAPSYIPVRVAADQLGDRPVPEALAEAVRRDLPGLRRSPSAELFASAPLPGVDWLVCVDSLDEVLDTNKRNKVIQHIQVWAAREPHMRFVVASRSLVTSEMHKLKSLQRYTLLEFGDEEIRKVARAWFEALEVTDPARRAQWLIADLRHGRLSEVAKNPLYLTMICIVTATGDLPRNPAELYARFIELLRRKGAQHLGNGGAGGYGITPALLSRVHDVLSPVAERRQAGDTRPLLDQVLDLLSADGRGEPPERDVVLRALTFTGLVTQRSGSLSFLHHTIQEYLAGQAIAGRLDPGDPEALRTLREAIDTERPNVILFMAAAWRARGHALHDFLRTAVRAGGWRELLLCATILSDEASTERELVAWFARAVIKLHGREVSAGGDLRDSTVLARLYAVLHEEDLRDIVRDRTIPHQPRLDALDTYVRRVGRKASDLAGALAGETDLPVRQRITAARLAATAGDPSTALDRLSALTRDPCQPPGGRLLAATAALRLDGTAATEPLAGLLATATDLDETDIFSVVGTIGYATDRDTVTRLGEALAANPVHDRISSHRFRHMLGSLLRNTSPEVLEGLAEDASAPPYLRVRALSAHGPLAHTVLDDLLRDATASDSLIQSVLHRCDDPRLVAEAARDSRLGHFTRRTAVERLMELGRLDTARSCVDALLSDAPDQADAIRLSGTLLDLGEVARERELMLSALTDAKRTVSDRLTCAARLLQAGEVTEVRGTLTALVTDPDVAASDRWSAVQLLHKDTAEHEPFSRLAADGTLPTSVRRRVAEHLLATGRRDAAASVLRALADDVLSGTVGRIEALAELAEIDLRTASETLHRMLDEPGILDEQLGQLLELADACLPDTPLRGRIEALLDDETVPAASLLAIERHHTEYRAAMVPLMRRALARIADDPDIDPGPRYQALAYSIGWMPYAQWRQRMATQGGADPLLRLSMHVDQASVASYIPSPGFWELLSFGRRGQDEFDTPTGVLAGVDPGAALAQWLELLRAREVSAVTTLRPLYRLFREEGPQREVDALLLGWAEDPQAPLTDRIAAVETGDGTPTELWYPLAADPTTPPELSVRICESLPTSGAHNRIPLTRALAAGPAASLSVRAKAAALLAEDLGEEGRALLRALSNPRTTDPEAHLAAAAAWESLDVGNEVVAACRRVLDAGGATAGQRVRAAQALARYRPVRHLAVRALRDTLADPAAPVAARVEAAEALLTLRATADAHLGLFRLARETGPGEALRGRMLELLPPDLRACVEAPAT
ncbi:trypsin-like peptidase domain-containing protein [Streptomyces sp. NPDC013455]|uniref:trypsin-like peptidase domain-containing protein n=1 Tax=Streptomyces sp. NPDC013455 TaxID=3155605 RepID=UPI00340E518D